MSRRKKFWYTMGIGCAGLFGANYLNEDPVQDIFVVIFALIIVGIGLWLGDRE